MIKLGDFGCAVSASEVRARELTVAALPVIERDYDPPENSQPAESTDIYQIGFSVLQMYCKQNGPVYGLPEMELEHWRDAPGSTIYSSELGLLLRSCVAERPEDRPRPRALLEWIRTARRTLGMTHVTLPF